MFTSRFFKIYINSCEILVDGVVVEVNVIHLEIYVVDVILEMD